MNVEALFIIVLMLGIMLVVADLRLFKRGKMDDREFLSGVIKIIEEYEKVLHSEFSSDLDEEEKMILSEAKRRLGVSDEAPH